MASDGSQWLEVGMGEQSACISNEDQASEATGEEVQAGFVASLRSAWAS